MKNKKIYLFSLFLLCSTQFVKAQSNKHLLEVSASGNYGLGYFFQGDIRTYDAPFDIQTSQSNLRANIRYTYLVNRRLGFGFSLTHQRFNNFLSGSYYYFDLPSNSQSSLLDLRNQESMAFDMVAPLLTIKYTSRISLIPFGLEHTWGIGPAFYSLVDKTYNTAYTGGSNVVQPTDFFEVQATEEMAQAQRYRGVNIFYNVDLNFPITSTQFLSLGIELYGNGVFRKDDLVYDAYPDDNSLSELVNWSYFARNQDGALRKRMAVSLLWIKIGYKFLL